MTNKFPDSDTLQRLGAWLQNRGHGSGSIENVSLLTGGTQNILMRFTIDNRDVILRRPPLHMRANSNDAMRREARMLQVLANSDIPHPRLIDSCDDESVIGAAFYLMNYVDGFNATTMMPAPHNQDPQLRHKMGLAMVDSAASLGELDIAGLADFGRPNGFLERQTQRWTALLKSYEEFENWPGADILPHIGVVAEWLEENKPTEFSPGIMHGDFHIANMLFRNDSPKLAAIVDWELATVGDPLLDLGWMIATWPDAMFPDGPILQLKVSPSDGFPQASELVARYASQSTRSLRSIGWYPILACFKLAIILEGTNARACTGKADRDLGCRMHQSAYNLMMRAEHWTNANVNFL